MDKETKAANIARLEAANVPTRAYGRSLKSHGPAGEAIRAYLAGDYVADATKRHGAIFMPSKPGLAASFARDIALTGASTYFAYLQRFATLDLGEIGLPQGFVIDYFEQEADSPFSGRERFVLETKLTELMDEGTILYVFTAIHPERSKWWSRQFMELLQENCRIVGIDVANSARRSRTPLVTGKAQGQENPRGSRRVAVR